MSVNAVFHSTINSLQLAQFQRIFPYDISIKLVLMRAVQLCHDVLTFSLIHVVTLPSLNLLLVTKESALDIYIQRYVLISAVQLCRNFYNDVFDLDP